MDGGVKPRHDGMIRVGEEKDGGIKPRHDAGWGGKRIAGSSPAMTVVAWGKGWPDHARP